MSISRYYNRVIKEIESVENINNSDVCYYINNEMYKISFSYLHNNNNYNVYIELDKYFPFRCPSILKINNKLYPYDCCNDADISSILYELYKIRCLWCNSLLCHNNWMPTITIKSLLDQCINNEIAIKLNNNMSECKMIFN